MVRSQKTGVRERLGQSFLEVSMGKANQGRVGSLGPATLNKSGGFGLQVWPLVHFTWPWVIWGRGIENWCVSHGWGYRLRMSWFAYERRKACF